MFSRTDLTDDDIFELSKILNLTSLKEIQQAIEDFFNRKSVEASGYKGFDYERDFLPEIRAHHSDILQYNKITDSLFSSLNDAPSYSIMTLAAILGATTFTILTLSILTIGITVVMLGTGIVYYVASYKEREHKRTKDTRDLDIITIKRECASAILNALEKRRAVTEGEEYAEPSPAVFNYVTKKKLFKFKQALGAATFTASMLIGTYYLGAIIVMSAFGATAAATAMLGPIGLGIAIGLSIAIGIYCGYKHYQSIVHADKIKKYKKFVNEDFDDKAEQCDNILQTTHTAEYTDSPIRKINIDHRRRSMMQRHQTFWQHPAPVSGKPPAKGPNNKLNLASDCRQTSFKSRL